jgi:hypothetical protein
MGMEIYVGIRSETGKYQTVPRQRRSIQQRLPCRRPAFQRSHGLGPGAVFWIAVWACFRS